MDPDATGDVKRWLPPALATLAMLALSVSSVATWQALSDARERIDELEAAAGDSSTDDAIASLESRIDTVAMRVDALQVGLDDASSDIGSVHREVEDLRGPSFSPLSLSGLETEIAGLTDCVNAYMQTVGDAGGGYYTYYLC